MTPNLDRTLLPEFHRASESVRRELPSGMLSEYPLLVGRVYGNPTVPTTTNVFVSINPVDVLGTDSEGLAGTLTVMAVGRCSYFSLVPSRRSLATS